ncbi:restriction endonuclease, SacI family [Methylobacterium sp. J-059]|uniref:restriction endonuclease, SacI family n=1 Tax=Methylobacterium sp. J-059 TaxID=2836643 RepID=UPI001FBB3F2E|nr:restriction endonuclease, SacI family [Methylobacterium sp. J-059]MCJ2040844.1 restriction endonuclease, SacI family [Methylobacterium sp. J-059]
MLSIDHAKADRILRVEAAKIPTDLGPATWCARVERLSELCIRGKAITHIAFLGTILLARSVDRRADVKWIKPAHAGSDAPNAFSARTLSEKVLVPVAAELGIHLGATGPQPLNNQPYFRMTYLGDDTPVRGNAKPAFDFMMSLVREIEGMDEAGARDALRAFVSVRMRHAPRYAPAAGAGALSGEELIVAVLRFVAEDSEGGKRAQAIVAGLLDVAFGTDRIVTDRINSPSRRYPGDVCVLADAGSDEIERAFEVKDKPVTVTDIQIFGRKCLDFAVRETAYVMVAEAQQPIDVKALMAWAHSLGLGMTLYPQWPMLVSECLFWGLIPSPDGAIEAVSRIRERLIAIEAAPASVERWERLVAAAKP